MNYRPMSFAELAESMNRFNLTNDQTLKAFAVARAIQQWLDEVCDGGTIPYVNVMVCRSAIEICIGDVGLWSSEGDSSENLNVDYCKQAYLHELGSYGSLLKLAADYWDDFKE